MARIVCHGHGLARNPHPDIFKVNVPGYGREHIKVQLEEGNILSIKGERLAVKEEKPKDLMWHVAGREKEGEFHKEFALSDNVRTDQIKAHIENGILTIIIPKETIPAKLKARTIIVSSKL